RPRDEAPGRAAVRAPVCTELATGGVAASVCRAWSDRLELRVKVTRIARRDGEIDTANLISRGGVHVGASARRVEPGPAVCIRRDRREIARTTSRWERAFVNA